MESSLNKKGSKGGDQEVQVTALAYTVLLNLP